MNETENILNNIRNLKVNLLINGLKFKKQDNLYLFLDESDNLLNQTNNLTVVNEVIRELLDLDFFIEFL